MLNAIVNVKKSRPSLPKTTLIQHPLHTRLSGLRAQKNKKLKIKPNQQLIYLLNIPKFNQCEKQANKVPLTTKQQLIKISNRDKVQRR